MPTEGTPAGVAPAEPATPGPGSTPLVPPPGVSRVGTVSAQGAPRRDETAPLGPEPPPEPLTEPPPREAPSAFADELPPGFWEELELPDPPQAARADGLGAATPTQSAARPAAPEGGERGSAKAVHGGTEAKRPEDDPRFSVLQSLFPGRVVAWQAHATDTGSEPEGGYDAPEREDAYDGSDERERVDLDD